MFTSNRLIYKTIEHFSSEGMKNESARRNLKETAKVTLVKEKDIDSSLAEKELEFKNSMKELEKLRGYPPGFLDNFVLKYPEIPISEVDELIQSNRNVVPDELDDLLSRCTFLTWDTVRNYLKTFPLESAKSYENSLIKDDPYLAVKYPKKSVRDSFENSDEIYRFDRESLFEQTLKIRKDVATFEKWWKVLNKKNPDVFKKVYEKNPGLEAKISDMTKSIRTINDYLQNISDNEFIEKVDTILTLIEGFNELVAVINQVLPSLESIIVEKQNNNENGVDIEALAEAEKKELKRFAKELYKEFFPSSYLDRAVLFYTGQKELEGYQKVLLAGGNGFEMAVKGVISLFDLDTYEESYDNMGALFELDIDEVKMLFNSLPDLFDQIDSADSVSAAITIIYAVVIFKGGIAKVAGFARKMGYSEKFISILKNVNNASAISLVFGKVGRVTPVAMLAATSLPYIKVAENI